MKVIRIKISPLALLLSGIEGKLGEFQSQSQ